MIKTLACLPLLAASWLATAWLFMIIVGAVHADWLPWLPTIGYKTALSLAGIYMACGLIRATFGAMIKVAVESK